TRREGKTITFIAGDTAVKVPWSQLHQESKVMAAALQAAGVKPTDHVAILGPTTRHLVTAIQATWLAGAATVLLPLPMRMGSIEEFVDQTRHRVRNADAKVLLVDADLAPFIEPVEGDPPMILLSELAVPGHPFKAPNIDPASLAILQFTSGSTAEPKGAMLPHRTVCANLDAIATAGALVEDDVLVSWLPLYHDMGLIGLLTLGMTTGTDLVLAAPQDFLASPSRWMQWMSDYKGTCTAGPNFSYALAARALKRLEGLDLSPWRLGLNGAEAIDPDAVERFVEAGARHGLRPGSVFCAFGMAEATLAVTFPVPMGGMRTDIVDKRVLETDRYAAPVDDRPEGTRRLARLGKPVPGLEIRITDPETGDPMKPREVGELEVRGTSVTTGYYKNPVATDAMFRNGWLRTGDLAYIVDGELVVCGRIKDLIIVGGRNVFPEDVERAVAMVEGVRAGNVIAFGVEGRRGQEAFVVVAETKSDDHPSLRERVAEKVRNVIGLPAREIVLVAPGTLPKTSSGKLQRSLCRTRYLAAGLQPV
ncbi:MAG TPA: fatty acyl-AMP ligase, partial [Acidimicrobiales bacterium]|nr:fatty acyl-AMP ligase [Acidimicrobiales bacterium]